MHSLLLAVPLQRAPALSKEGRKAWCNNQYYEQGPEYSLPDGCVCLHLIRRYPVIAQEIKPDSYKRDDGIMHYNE